MTFYSLSIQRSAKHEMTDIISFSSTFFLKKNIYYSGVTSRSTVRVLCVDLTGLQSDIVFFSFLFFAAYRSEKRKIRVFSK